MLDTYNQQIHNFVSCTIRTNINTANHHFIVMEESQVMRVGNIYPSQGQNGDVYNVEGISPTISAGQGVNGRGIGSCNAPKITEPMCSVHPNSQQKDNYLCIPEATKKDYAEAYEGDSVNIGFPSSKTRRGKVGHQMCNTLDTGCQQGVVTNYRIRKLTPRECFRLMGVDDADIETLLNAGLSNTRLYALAGNSIVVDNLCHILRTLFVDKPTKQVKQLTLF